MIWSTLKKDYGLLGIAYFWAYAEQLMQHN
jgi:hypothetical protein